MARFAWFLWYLGRQGAGERSVADTPQVARTKQKSPHSRLRLTARRAQGLSAALPMWTGSPTLAKP